MVIFCGVYSNVNLCHPFLFLFIFDFLYILLRNVNSFLNAWKLVFDYKLLGVRDQNKKTLGEQQ